MGGGGGRQHDWWSALKTKSACKQIAPNHLRQPVLESNRQQLESNRQRLESNRQGLESKRQGLERRVHCRSTDCIWTAADELKRNDQSSVNPQKSEWVQAPDQGITWGEVASKGTRGGGS